MRHSVVLLLLFTYFFCTAQPEAINYQGVARDSVGHPLINTSIEIRLSILDNTAMGASVYCELHNILTNNAGLFNLSIGTGNIISGDFSNIAWSHARKWLMVEMAIGIGSNFQLVGTTEILSVPYSFYSGKAGSLIDQSTPDNIKTLIYTSDGF